MRIWILLFVASTAWADAPAPRLDSAELAHKLEAALSGGKPRQSPTEIRQQLEALKAQAAPREQPLIDRMIALLAEVDTLSAPELVSRSAQLTHDLQALAPNDFQTQRNAAALLDHLWLESSGLDGVPDLSRDARRAATELTEKFPGEAGAWGRLASHLINEEGASEAALRALHKCSRLDPKSKWCRDTFAQVAVQFTQPRCEGADLQPGLAIWRGNVEQPSLDTPRTMMLGGRSYFTGPSPALAGKEIVALELQVGGGLLVGLADRRKLEPFRASVAWKDAWTLVTVGDQPVAAAPRAMPRPQGLVLVTTLDLARVCRRVQHRALPKDL